jgi:transposase InsO family protein
VSCHRTVERSDSGGLYFGGAGVGVPLPSVLPDMAGAISKAPALPGLGQLRLKLDKVQTQVEARMAIFEFIEGWHNPHRRHSALDYQSPINDERSRLPLN